MKRRRKRNHKFRNFLLTTIILIAIVSGVYGGTRLYVHFTHPLTYEDYINIYSKDNELDKYFVMAVIKAESNFDTEAHSGVATGLMQLTDETAHDLCKQLKIDYSEIDLKKPKDNIRLGCYYLKKLIDNYSYTDVALAAYNGGPANVNKWLDDENYSHDGKTLYYIPYKETREYVERVNKYWNNYKTLYEKKDSEKQNVKNE